MEQPRTQHQEQLQHMQSEGGPCTSPVHGWDEFCAGVTACLRSWSAFRTAVVGGWGGVESTAKAEFLRTTIYGYFSSSSSSSFENVASIRNVPAVSLEELEDHLAIYLEEEFSVQLEDNSEREVASVIFQLFETCLRQQDMKLAQQVVASALAAEHHPATTMATAQVQSMEDDEDDDDDGDIAMMTSDTSNFTIASSSNNASQQNNYTPVQVPLPSSITSPILPLPSSLPPAAEYAAGLLFATPEEQAQHKQRMQQQQQQQQRAMPPVRQLGEAAPEVNAAAVMDDDGFAPVVSKKKKR